MAISRREATMMVGGLLLGVAAAWAVFGSRESAPDAAAAAPEPQRSELAVETAAAPDAAAAAPAASCTFAPVVAKGGEGDGELVLEKDLAGRTEAQVRDFLTTGKEAAAAGRPRDAEVAFLMACRAAEKLEQGEGMPLADAMYRLGRHYAVTADAPGAARREELRKRARALYASSLQAYRAEYGDEHERTRFAAEGLARLQEPGGAAEAEAAPAVPGEQAEARDAAAPARAGKADAATAAERKADEAKAAERKAAERKAAEAKAAEAKAAETKAAAARAAAEKVAAEKAAAEKAAAEKAAAAAKAAQQAAAQTRAAEAAQAKAEAEAERQRDQVAAHSPGIRPSFDCAKARSTSEKIICADADLARQDRELGRLHARAKRAADDPRAFQRRSDAAWSEREATCTDRACLQRWYAQRRQELRAAASAPPPVESVGQATGDPGAAAAE